MVSTVSWAKGVLQRYYPQTTEKGGVDFDNDGEIKGKEKLLDSNTIFISA